MVSLLMLDPFGLKLGDRRPVITSAISQEMSVYSPLNIAGVLSMSLVS